MKKGSFEKDFEVGLFLEEALGLKCDVAQSSYRKWGKGEVENGDFYQIMSDEDFFNWYVYTRSEYQFFESAEVAALYFMKYYIKWSGLGKPKPF